MVLQIMIFSLSVEYICPLISYFVPILPLGHSQIVSLCLQFVSDVLKMCRNRCNICCVFFAYNSFMFFTSTKQLILLVVNKPLSCAW